MIPRHCWNKYPTAWLLKTGIKNNSIHCFSEEFGWVFVRSVVNDAVVIKKVQHYLIAQWYVRQACWFPRKNVISCFLKETKSQQNNNSLRQAPSMSRMILFFPSLPCQTYFNLIIIAKLPEQYTKARQYMHWFTLEGVKNFAWMTSIQGTNKKNLGSKSPQFSPLPISKKCLFFKQVLTNA